MWTDSDNQVPPGSFTLHSPTPNPGSSTVNTEPAGDATVPVARSPKENG